MVNLACMKLLINVKNILIFEININNILIFGIIINDILIFGINIDIILIFKLILKIYLFSSFKIRNAQSLYGLRNRLELVPNLMQ